MADADIQKVELEMSPASQYKHDIKTLTVHSVTVYTDRAEVKRTLKLSVDKAGDIEAIVDGLSDNCDFESIRVEGRGHATITEVTSVEKLTEKPEVDENAVKSIQDQITDLQYQISVLEAEKKRVVERKGIIQGLGQQVQTPTVSSADSKKEGSTGVSLLSSEGLDGIVRFLDMYNDQLQILDGELFRIDREIKTLRDKIRVLNDQNTEQRNAGSKVDKIRQVSILMDVQKAGEITLTISYLVRGASWTPSYDIRAFSEDSCVKITYFGLIKQKTGEDWNEAKLFLSTAQPSVGGVVPVLPSQTVNFKVPVVERMHMPRMKSRMMSDAPQPQMMVAMSSMSMERGAAPPPPSPMMQVAAAEVQGGAMSTSYEVARKSTIPSDNAEHKVTVAMFDLKPEFEHITIPKMVASSFLKAKLTNESPYLILAGPSSVFVDNNFIAKSTLPTVSPSEKFECSLGVDFAVRVDYRPCHKVNETAGYWSKTIVTRYQQPIEVKNTHQHEVKIQVEEQLPRSENDKIKVVLVSPVIPKDKNAAPDGPLTLNNKGNIVWRSSIKAGSTETFTLHYTVEKPADSADIEFRDY